MHDSIDNDRAFKRAIAEWRAQDIHSVPPALMEKALKQARIERARTTHEMMAWLGSRVRETASLVQGWASARRTANRYRRGPAVPRPVIDATS